MLCILPQPSEDADVTINIEQTLIKAHCWENGIRVLKVHIVKVTSYKFEIILQKKKEKRKETQSLIDTGINDSWFWFICTGGLL